MATVAFFTLGCKVNQQETGALASLFAEEGFAVGEFDGPADVYIINSCVVTGDAERKSLTVARRQKNRHRDAVVVLAGCFPQVSLERARAAGVDLIAGSNQKAQLVGLVRDYLEGKGHPVEAVTPFDDSTAFEVIATGYSSSRVRGTLKVQDGCQQRCAYCIIPDARGRERSLALPRVIEQARGLVASGYRELVLSGIRLGAYGRDLVEPTDLATLVAELAAIDGLQRLRLGSVEPNDVTPSLLEQLAVNSKLCRHLHLPLQSGSDHILARMGRRYNTGEFRALVAQLRAQTPDIGITTDVIVGFPGESDDDFRATLGLVRELNFARVHTFKFSRRTGTPAATMGGQLSQAVKVARHQALQDAAAASALAFNRDQIGKIAEVLIEDCDAEECSGYSSSYARVRLPRSDYQIGEIVVTRVVEALSDFLLGGGEIGDVHIL